MRKSSFHGRWVAVGLLAGAFAASGSSVPSARAACGDPTEYWTGTNNADTRYDTTDGVDEQNIWTFKDGQDFGRSLPCVDTQYGGEHADDLGGGSAQDNVYGQLGNDDLYGGQARDGLVGSDGADELFDSETGDDDIAWGQIGPDLLDLRDGDTLDEVDGGAGTDNCNVDPGEPTINCP